MSHISQSESFLVITLNILVITLNRIHVPWHWEGRLLLVCELDLWVCELWDVSLWVRKCKSESTSLWTNKLTKCASSWLATYNLQTRDLQVAGLWLATCMLVTCNSHNSHTLTFSDLSHCDVQPHLEVLMLHQLVRNMFHLGEPAESAAERRSHLQMSDYNMTVQSTVLITIKPFSSYLVV